MQAVKDLAEELFVGDASLRCARAHLDEALLCEVVQQDAHDSQREIDVRGKVRDGDRHAAQVQDPDLLRTKRRLVRLGLAPPHDVQQCVGPVPPLPGTPAR